ncbi:MAG TPA: tetratricopeptide repeat protein, partial [Acidobacteriaceae bacterium]|nr:tetratricopeptide repeat protein [Acidobacteriaceae bacterium]
MAPVAARESAAGSPLQPKRVFELGAICLIAGLAIGYVCAGSSSTASAAHTEDRVVTPMSASPTSGAHPVTLADMKEMADKQAAPLIHKLSSEPNDTATLGQIGAIYHVAHQYSEAAAWYQRAVQSDPRNVNLRTKLATSLYRQGDVDGALAQLNEALKIDPKDANALFNL